ncbi:MAG: response regulator [Verrucomicrobiota bacterium]
MKWILLWGKHPIVALWVLRVYYPDEERSGAAILLRPVRGQQLARIAYLASPSRGNYQECATDINGVNRVINHLTTVQVDTFAALPTRDAENIRILVAEDDDINQLVIADLLGQLGGKADIAVNGWEAIARVQTSPYDVVLMDCQMPEMDGYEATRKIRQWEETALAPGGFPAHIVALTASAMAGDREKCLAAGMNDYLSKPLRAHELRAMLANWRLLRGYETSSRLSPTRLPGAAAKSAELIASGTVDWDRLRDITRGNSDRLRALLEAILSRIPQYLSDIKAAIQTGSAPDVRRAAHKCAGSSGQAGLLALAQVLRNLEEFADAGDLTRSLVLLSDASQEFETVQAKVESKLQSLARTLPGSQS